MTAIKHRIPAELFEVYSRNAGEPGVQFDATAVTAHRTITLPNADLDLGGVDDRIDVLEGANGTRTSLGMTSGGFGTWTEGSASEEVTVSGQTTKDSTANLLPANSAILGVVVKVTQAIAGGGVATVTAGIAGATARFGTLSALTLNATDVLLDHLNTPTIKQNAAAKVRFTMNAAPVTGKVRVTVFYRTFVAE